MPLNEYQFVECCKLTNFFLFSHQTPWSPLQSPPKPTPSGRHHLEIGQRQCEKNCRLNFNHQMDGNRRSGTITCKSVNYSIAVYKQKGNVKHSVAKRKRETRRSTQRCTQQMNLVVSGIGSDLWPGGWPKKNLCGCSTHSHQYLQLHSFWANHSTQRPHILKDLRIFVHISLGSCDVWSITGPHRHHLTLQNPSSCHHCHEPGILLPRHPRWCHCITSARSHLSPWSPCDRSSLASVSPSLANDSIMYRTKPVVLWSSPRWTLQNHHSW